MAEAGPTSPSFEEVPGHMKEELQEALDETERADDEAAEVKEKNEEQERVGPPVEVKEKNEEQEPQQGAVKSSVGIKQDEFAGGYDPTSPAEEEPEFENVPLDETVQDAAVDEKVPLTSTAAVPGARNLPVVEEKVVICPKLLVGSKLSKECMLKPGRWVEVGRHSKAHVLMNNPAVSKHHCKLQWKRSGSVELKVLDGVTYVNEKRLNIGSAASLKHGDLLKINGKGVSFRLLVDMRPVDSSLPDVKTLENFANGSKESQQPPRSPEDEMRRRIRKLRASAATAREKAFELEQRFVDVQTRRAKRKQQMQEDLDKSLWFEKDADRLEAVLIKSRDTWMERLQDAGEKADKAMKPINAAAGEIQVKRDSLAFLAQQQERAVNPNRHISVTSVEPTVPVVAMENASSPKREPANKFAAQAGEADGEEEAFADAPARGPGDEELVKPSVEVLKKAPKDEEMADLFGDFDSDEELEAQAKRHRVE